jgi:hypothetical protein
MTQMEWISVKDRLPEEYKYRPGDRCVLVLTKDGDIELDKITYPKDGNLWECTLKDVITHWMFVELPEQGK